MARSSAERVRDHRARQKELEAVKAHGRALGEDEVARRGEVGERASQRVSRAVAYAVWLFEDMPVSGRPLEVSV